MRRSAIPLAVIALAGILLGAPVTPAAVAQNATPAVEETGPPPGLSEEVLAFGMTNTMPAVPAMVIVARVTIAPGADITAAPNDPAMSIFYVESGSLTIVADAPLSVGRGAALAEALATPDTMPSMDDIAAGAEFSLASGDSLVAPPGIGGSLRNDGTEPVVVLVTNIIPAEA